MSGIGGGSGPAPVSWVGAALDGEGAWRLRSALPYVLGLLMLFDSWDSVVIAYTLPPIAGEWSLTTIEAGWLISAGYAGQFAGALFFGAVAERKGRIPVFAALVLTMSMAAIFCAFAATYGQLIAGRLIQGMAVGGALPLGMCYVNEIAPSPTRGRFFGTFQFLAVSGYGVAALTSIWIVPEFGWRTMFLLGALPLLAVPFLWRLPESPRWLAARGRKEAARRSLLRLGAAPTPAFADDAPMAYGRAETVPLSELLAPGTRRKSLVMGALWFLTSLVSFGLVTWIPSIYVSQFGLPLQRALAYNSVAAVSVFFVPLALRFTIDRYGRIPIVVGATAMSAVTLLAMVPLMDGDRLLLVGLSILGQIGISAGSMILWPYTAEIYPTRIRSLAMGTGSGISRAASMLTPLLVGGLLAATGSAQIIFLAFGIAAALVAGIWWTFASETAGRALVD